MRDNPYRLAADVPGIGFKTADKIARSVGIEKDAPVRLVAGLEFSLQEAANRGHMYLTRDQLLAAAADILEVDGAQLPPMLAQLVAERRVVEEKDLFYMPRLYRAETELAAGLRRLHERFLPSASSVTSIRIGNGTLSTASRRRGFASAMNNVARCWPRWSMACLCSPADRAQANRQFCVRSLPVWRRRDKKWNWLALPEGQRSGCARRRVAALAPFIDCWSSVRRKGKVFASNEMRSGRLTPTRSLSMKPP